MPNAEECRWETSEYEERQKQRVKRHKDRCKDYGLFDPRGWVCTVVTFFEEVWVTVTVTVREWVCTVVEVAEEWIEYGRRVYRVVRVHCGSLGRCSHRQRHGLLADRRRRSRTQRALATTPDDVDAQHRIRAQSQKRRSQSTPTMAAAHTSTSNCAKAQSGGARRGLNGRSWRRRFRISRHTCSIG